MLRFVALVLLFIVFSTTLILSSAKTAAADINRTLNFHGRLLSSDGSPVPDGHYNVQFKIYEGGSGSAVDNPDGTLKWTETYVNNGGTSGVEVQNGLISVNLGSNNPFGTSIDWNQGTLWLSLNIAGSSTSCTTFGTAPCVSDGEMLPMKRLTSTPYAMNAGAVGGLTTDNLLQLAQGVQTDASTNTSSIFINKTGSGDLIQLQNTGVDIFTVSEAGDISFGNNADHTLSVDDAAAGTDGKQLTVQAANGGSGTGNTGGNLNLQGGGGGGTNGDGGDIYLSGGDGTGTGTDGSIFIGSSNTDTIQIGQPDLASGTQTINIGNNSGAGTTNVTIGSDGSAGSGSTNIQSKDNTTISTNGTTRAVFDTSGTLTLGNGETSAVPDDFKIQGTSSSVTGVAGGDLTIQGGGATAGNANGGNLHLSGGDGIGTGVDGLVVIDTPTYSTASVQSSAVNTTVTQASIDSFGVITLKATADNLTFDIGDPSLGANAIGRIIYVTADNGSKEFTLRANNGDGAGVEQNVTLRQNSTAPLLWNGTLWTVVGGAGSTLQAAYANTPQSAADAEIVVENDENTGGLTIRDSATNPVNGTLLEVQSSSAATLFSVNSNINELATNPGMETAGASSGTFPTNTLGVAGSATVSRYTTPGDYVASGRASALVQTTGTSNSGAYNKLSTALSPNKKYNVTVSVKLDSSSAALTDLAVAYSSDGTASTICQNAITVTSTEWTKVTCSFQTPASGITASNGIALAQVGAVAHTFYIDNLSVTPGGATTAPDGTGDTNATANVQVGGGSKGGSPTLFTLDKNASAPTSTNHEALLGSMYYDTTVGKVQCYEASGWGECGDRPDHFVTLSPEYPNAVMNGTDIGTISSDLCSGSLNINDGSGGQPTVCANNETYNFYDWTSAEVTTQTKSIFVTYQLPDSFKEFIPNSTSLMSRTDSADSATNYQIYRNNSSGLTACGSTVAGSTGVQTSWIESAASGTADPANCNFEPGDSIVFRINLSAKSDAHAYISTLNLTFKD